MRVALKATTAKLREEMDSAGYIFSGTRGSWSGEDTKRNAAVVLGKSKASAAPCRGVQSATVKVAARMRWPSQVAQRLATHELTMQIVEKAPSPHAQRQLTLR